MKIVASKKSTFCGTNTANIPRYAQVIEADSDEEVFEISDKIKDASDDFDYILSGIDQLDDAQANEVLNELHESLQVFIQEIANQLS